MFTTSSRCLRMELINALILRRFAYPAIAANTQNFLLIALVILLTKFLSNSPLNVTRCLFVAVNGAQKLKT